MIQGPGAITALAQTQCRNDLWVRPVPTPPNRCPLDRNVRLVNIKPNIRDTIPHDPSPMREARRGQSGATLVTCIL